MTTMWKNYLKKEAVLMISGVLAIGSAFFVKPGISYLEYIDYRVLALLLCFMLVVAGWQKLGVFGHLSQVLCKRVKTTRGLGLTLISLCFFTSMLITNDVALITFVPFTISLLILIEKTEFLVTFIVLETLGANLGSMLTPIGNPQNLFLFSKSKISVVEFIWTMAPLWSMAVLILVVFIWFQKNERVEIFPFEKSLKSHYGQSGEFWIYNFLFVICLGNVFHLVHYGIVLIIVVGTMFIVDKRLFGKVDFNLLITFVLLFIFIGNLGRIPWVKNYLETIILGNEMEIGILSSQFMSNVPASMLLAGFTTDYKALLWGVNLGGLGTLIASMASLISYKFYVNSPGARKSRYLKIFTLYNVIFLILLWAAARGIR